MSRFIVMTVCLAISIDRCHAQQFDAARIFPESSVVFAKLNGTESMIRTLLDHPIRKRIESLDDIQTALKSNDFVKFRTGVGFVEFALDKKWDAAISDLTAGGVFACVDAQTEGVALIAVAKNEETLSKTMKTVLNIVGGGKNNQPKNYKEKKYRDLTAYKFDQILVTRIENKLLLSNKDALAKQIVDTYLDKTDKTLASKVSYREFVESSPVASNFTVFVDLGFLRSAGMAKELFREKAENIAAEFLLGGIMEAIREADYAALNVALSREKISASLAVPFDVTSVSSSREYYFGKGGQGETSVGVAPKNEILNVSTYRDLGGLWLSKEELLEENEVAGLTQADSNLTTVFSGLDFGEEVLGAAKPGIQFVAVEQDFSNSKLPVPDIKLPSFALLFRLENPAKMQRRFKIGFQSFVGFINIQQAQQGLPQFDLESTTTKDDAKIVSAAYFNDGENKNGLINYNFSPTLAFAGDRFIVSSTSQLAAELVSQPESKRTQSGTNSSVTVHAKSLGNILKSNREQLIAQNMLEEGNDRESAEKEIDTLLELITSAKDIQLRLRNEKKQLRLEFDLNFSLGD